jgi:hypothetical protein
MKKRKGMYVGRLMCGGRALTLELSQLRDRTDIERVLLDVIGETMAIWTLARRWTSLARQWTDIASLFYLYCMYQKQPLQFYNIYYLPKLFGLAICPGLAPGSRQK